MKSILFCRVSSKEQEDTGYSLPAQEKLLNEYREKKGFGLAKVFSISESASGKKQRQTFDEMMQFVKKNNINIIICEKVDRLTRNLRDAVDINDWINANSQREVHFVKENVVLNKDSKSNEKFIWNIKVSVAQYYIDNLSEEVKKGQKEKIAQGWLPTRPPVGYKTVGEKGRKIHVIDENKAPLVKKMFELYAGGNYSLKRLTAEMEEIGLTNEAGNKLVKSRIHQLLTGPFYIGKNRWNNELYEGKQETFISEDTFNKVQNLLKSKTTPKYSKHGYLFKGLIHCQQCTGVVTWEIQKGIVYGHCNRYRNCPKRPWVTEPNIEKQLLDKLSKLEIRSSRLAEWLKKAIKESHKDEMHYHSTSVEELHKQHEQLKLRLDRLYDDKLDGKITEEDYNRRNKRYAEELTQVDKTIAKHSTASLKYFELGLNFFNISQRGVAIYQKANLDDKRSLLNLVFKNLILDNNVLTFQYTRPFEILAGAIEGTNSSKIEEITKMDDKIFEPSEKTDITLQTEDFYTYRPVVLALTDYVGNYYREFLMAENVQIAFSN